MSRSFFITKKDTEQHGYSAKCPGCASVIRGTTRQAHSAACRMRFGEIFKGTEKHKMVEEKFERHMVRALERQDEADRKRRKVDQEKTEAAGTLDARERWRKLARRGWQRKRLSGTTSDHGQEDQKPDKPADRPTNDETSAWKWMAWTAKRSRKTNCTSRAWRPTPMETSAVRTSVLAQAILAQGFVSL